MSSKTRSRLSADKQLRYGFSRDTVATNPDFRDQDGSVRNRLDLSIAEIDDEIGTLGLDHFKARAFGQADLTGRNSSSWALRIAAELIVDPIL